MGLVDSTVVGRVSRRSSGGFRAKIPSSRNSRQWDGSRFQYLKLENLRFVVCRLHVLVLVLRVVRRMRGNICFTVLVAAAVNRDCVSPARSSPQRVAESSKDSGEREALKNN